MKYYVEENLRNFNFWSGGKERADLLNSEQLDTVEQLLEEMEPEEGWSDTAINDMFWFDFDTICQHLGYKDEEHLEKGVSDNDIQEAEDWAEEKSEDYDGNMFEIANLNRDDYRYTDEDGQEEFDYSCASYDFRNWWDEMDDFAKVETYNKYQSGDDDCSIDGDS